MELRRETRCPICFNISSGDEFSTGASRGEGQSRWSLRIFDTPTPPQMQAHPSPYLHWLLLGPFRNTKVSKWDREGGGGPPLLTFSICRQLREGEGPSCIGRWRIQTFFLFVVIIIFILTKRWRLACCKEA